MSAEEPTTDLLYGPDVRPALRETLFVGMITPPLLIAG
jgi:hypothetical protein